MGMDYAATYLQPIKYGRNSLELKKGMNAIRCETVEQPSEALAAIKALVLKGDFDSQLGKASKEIRVRFKAG
jgi:hypothetical protein